MWVRGGKPILWGRKTMPWCSRGVYTNWFQSSRIATRDRISRNRDVKRIIDMLSYVKKGRIHLSVCLSSVTLFIIYLECTLYTHWFLVIVFSTIVAFALTIFDWEHCGGIFWYDLCFLLCWVRLLYAKSSFN